MTNKLGKKNNTNDYFILFNFDCYSSSSNLSMVETVKIITNANRFS